MSKQFVLRTDASDEALGAVLLQEHEGMLHPVLYGSRKLSASEKNFAAIERECLALVWAIGKYAIYLYGKEFVVETDHQPLEYLNKTKLNNARVMRWSLSLQEFTFRIKYIKGKDNIGADYLSRV